LKYRTKFYKQIYREIKFLYIKKQKGKEEKSMKRKILSAILVLTLAATVLVGCGSKKADDTTKDAAKTEETGDAEDKVIVIGASPTPHAEILEAARETLEAEGYTLEVKEYSDYVQPNVALTSGDLDANYFQHVPYLEQYNEENGTDIESAGIIHYEPVGIYPGKIASIDDLKDGSQIGVPNDATNEARALALLEAQGIIKLKEGVGINATKQDIIENPKNVEIVEVEAAQLPRSLADLDLAVINGNYAIEAELSVATDAIAIEDADSIGAQTYGNIVAVRKGEVDTDKTKALVKALQSEDVKKFIEEKYDGAVVAIF
jgi:D-methionine transport system substrate-binding protein